MDNDKPTDAQIGFATKLGITNPSQYTKKELSQEIDKVTGKDTSNTPIKEIGHIDPEQAGMLVAYAKDLVVSKINNSNPADSDNIDIAVELGTAVGSVKTAYLEMIR